MKERLQKILSARGVASRRKAEELIQAGCVTVNGVAAKLGDTGRILVRESGTEPVIRVMVEAATQEECQKYVDNVVDVICARGHARV